MLDVLRIQNYALIDDLEVEFGAGFNVLTGETGAGKSIIIGALNLVLGGRANPDTVRDAARPAKVDAVFRVPKPSRRLTEILRTHEIAIEDGELMLSRMITPEGRSRAYVCGNLLPVSVLSEIGDELVDIHGQHDHQSLLKPDRQLELLDGFGGSDHAATAVAEAVARLRELGRAIADLESTDRERERRIGFLSYEIQEIDSADLRPGEEEELKGRRNIIANAERIASLVSHARGVLYEGVGEELPAAGALDAATVDLEELGQLDDRFRVLADQLTGVRVVIDEVAGELRSLTDRLEFDPGELDRVNQRLVAIGNLKRKFGSSIEAILAYRTKAAAEVSAYAERDQRLTEMQAERAKCLSTAAKMAAELSERRKQTGRKLDRLVTQTLQNLGMRGGRFETRIEPVDLGSDGVDRIEFLLSANVGEKPKSLRLVASGGEISRVMLALKTVFAGADKIPTLIFDEIDAGVGGQTARAVADQLALLARSHQTVCITHIPQIAAVAAMHYHVFKRTQQGKTRTDVASLVDKARVEEIARLLDGSVSDVSLKHAQALLQELSSPN